MKKVINLFVILLIFQSCSDKLTESKVEDLINECSMKNPIYGQSILKSGKVSYLSDDDIKKYQELNNFLLDNTNINKEDLFGEPQIGRRFKGNIWMQGCIRYMN